MILIKVIIKLKIKSILYMNMVLKIILIHYIQKI
nr:MAG TPA: hypothetical protein [Caudoviricetes sp.]DAY42091.1 MAG TPA: hypothetical protein [Caudoviricetes sp.]